MEEARLSLVTDYVNTPQESATNQEEDYGDTVSTQKSTVLHVNQQQILDNIRVNCFHPQ